ncbi:MAG: hypothetical protein BLITH_0679 [Brockia lithotrophica]|uniref:Uncharacterized protein n=1 Tax=Brockia lithotrophica TaxID=933949 RepID=A0A2T5G8J3_9BACL|nr:MAG: hypothetical protein BLITH_0679 [Brockia lithotrophica]
MGFPCREVAHRSHTSFLAANRLRHLANRPVFQPGRRTLFAERAEKADFCESPQPSAGQMSGRIHPPKSASAIGGMRYAGSPTLW